MKIFPNSQWTDKGTYKEPNDSDNVRVPRLEVDDATTYIDKDGSNNMTLTDAVTGTKTLAELAAGGAGTPATTVTSETTFGITAAVGTGTDYARNDHTHGSPTDPVTAHTALTTGVHGVGAGTVAKTSDITATKIDDLTAGDDNTDLDVSTTKHGLAPKAVAPAAGLINVYGLANAETAITNKPLFDATSPSTQAFADAAAVGTATVTARRDHKHAMMADPVTAHVAAGDPHTVYALDTDLSTHAGAADPHTGYRLESADHSHQTTGAQAGQLDHGLAMTAASLLDDDHTQYRLETVDNTHA